MKNPAYRLLLFLLAGTFNCFSQADQKPTFLKTITPPDTTYNVEIAGVSYKARILSTPLPTVQPEIFASEGAEKSKAAAGCDIKWGEECKGDIFNGCILRDIKLDYVDARYKSYKNPKVLLQELSKDKTLITTSLKNNRTRTKQENKNVIIEEAWLFMVSRESDNDFHLILGDKENYKTSKLFSAEISALPEDKNYPDYDQLKKVRAKFIKVMSGGPPSCSNSKKFTLDLTANPVKMTIKGSLFFDNQHKNGGSGYGSVKTPTAWEIHPTADFDLLEQ